MDDDEQMELALNSNFDSELFDCWDDGDGEEVRNGNDNNSSSGGAGGAKRVQLQHDVSSGAGRRRAGFPRGSAHRSGDDGNPGGNNVEDWGALDRGDLGEMRVGDDPCWESPEAFERFSRLPSFSMMDNDYDARRTDLDDDDNVEESDSAERPLLSHPPPTEMMKEAKRATKGRTAREGATSEALGKPSPSAVVSSYSSIASSAAASGGPGTSTLSCDTSCAAMPHSSDESTARPSASPSGPSGHDPATQMHPLGTLSSAKCPPLPASGGITNHHGHPSTAVPSDLQGAAFYPLALTALAAGAAAAANANATMNGQYLLDAMSNANNHAVAAAAVAAIIGGNHHHHGHHQPHMHQQSQNSSAEPGSANAAGINTQQQRMPPSEAAAAGHSGAAGGSSGRGTPVMSYDAAAAPIELRANFENSMRAHGMLDANSVPFSFGVSVNGFHPQQGMMGSASSSVTGDMSAAASRLGAGLGGVGEKHLKNAKEQVRAQKIAELIDELREKMQKSGWSVGVSKSKFNTLSSCADYVKHLVKVTKEKEEAVRKARNDLEATRRKIDEDKSQLDPSDPESTTSSLTASSSSGTSRNAAGLAQGRKKRDGEFDGRDGAKKPKLSTHDSSLSSSSGDDTNKNPSGIRVLDLDHATSSVSDLTDSHNGSHSHHHKSEWTRNRTRHRPIPRAPVDERAESGVAEADHDGGKEHTHSARTHKRKPSLSEQSNSPGFELDYREAFVKSNVPQLIATTAGRIIAYNDFFLAITGMSSSDVDRATIFSFVKPSRLSNLFEMVAKSLRSAEPDEAKSGDASQEASSESSNKTWNYEAMTLPCTRFPATSAKQLYVTVTLMTDVDPRKRCFHCVLTDTPCTNGDIGRITPELLEMLFASKSTTKK